MKLNFGQGLLEVIFSIGVVMLVVTGVVTLLINMIGSRSKSYDRNKAVELSQVVVETMIAKENDDGTSFWDPNSQYWLDLATSQTNPNFSNYYYSARMTPYTLDGCRNIIPAECLTVTVNVGWNAGEKIDSFNRFFSRK